LWGQKRKLANPFDHLVGAGQEHRRHFEAKGLRGFQIDDKFEFDRLNYRQIGRFGASENLSGVVADLAISVREADTVTHEATSQRILAELIDGRHTMFGLERDDPIASGIEEGIGTHQKGIGPLPNERFESRFQFRLAFGICNVDALNIMPSRCSRMPNEATGSRSRQKRHERW
jgi:hypothetical protein